MIPEHVRNPDPSRYMRDDFLVVDFETTNRDKGSALNPDNNVVMVTWAHGPTGTVREEWGTEFELPRLAKAVSKAGFLVMQNAKFDLQWLARCGIDLSPLLVWDTMLGEYVRLGNRVGPMSLGALAKRYGVARKDRIGSALIGAGVCPSHIPASILGRYGKLDTDVTRSVFLAQRQELKALNLLPVMYTRCLLTPVLADMETVGMFLDEERVLESYDEESAILQQVVQELDDLTGGINLNSAKQRGEFIFTDLAFEIPTDHKGNPLITAKGQPKTDQATLATLTATTSEQRNFLSAFKKLTKSRSAISKNLDFFKGVVEENGGKFYAILHQNRTATHRLSSSGRPVKFEQFTKPKSVQFQNLPRRFKNRFRARHDGWLLAEADGAQLEFRVAGYLGSDEQAKEDILSGVDVHELASSVLKITRQDAKAETFRPLYGGQGDTPARRRYAKAFRTKYSGIAKTQEGWTYEVLKTKQLVTPWGLRYYWPDCKVVGDGYINHTTSIYNYPVQGLATAEIIPIAVVYIWHRMKAAGMLGFLVNTIHDSIIAEIPPEEVELFRSIVVQGLTTDVYSYLHIVYNLEFDVPLGVGLKIGKFWTEAEEEKITPPNPFLKPRGKT